MTEKIRLLSSCRHCVDRARNLPAAPDNVGLLSGCSRFLDFIQIGSLSVEL